MSTPLLLTKLNLPPARQNLVRRERLFQRLDAGLAQGHLLTLVCAPAGFGKTTLVSEWIYQHKETGSERKYAWLTCERTENDLARFVAYLVAALEKVEQEVGESVLAALKTTRPPAISILATLLINEITRLGADFVLVLDDFHTITAQPVHEFITYLVDHQPPRMHLVVITRSDPPLPLSRLRARGQMSELRQHELAFSLEESAEFLSQTAGLEIDPEQLAILESRTEGWVAGLQLAALSMRKIEDIPGFIEEFSGGYDYIADYLTGEVLDQQTDEVKDFLLKTSILEQLSASLCEAITGQQDSGRIIEQLRQDNLFILPLDYQGEWYRYHGLFADLLRKRLYQLNPADVLALHRGASRWYREHGMFHPAVEHALEGRDYPAMSELIEAHAERILVHGETGTFLRWLESFPAEELHAKPVLVAYQGLALMLSGQRPEKPLAFLQEIARSEESLGEADVLQALYSVMKGDAAEAIRFSELSLNKLPEERSFLRILAFDSLAMAHALLGDSRAAGHAFEQVAALSQEADSVIMTLAALSNLAGLRYQAGELHAAADLYRQVIEISRERLGGRSQPMGKALLGLGELAREWNDLERARDYLFEAADLFQHFVDIGLPLVYLALSRVYIAQGAWDKAQGILDEAMRSAEATRTTPLDDSLTELMGARFLIARGELEQAERWARSRDLLDRPAGDIAEMAEHSSRAFEMLQGEYLTLVRLYIAQGRSSHALEILEVLLSHNEQMGQMRRVIEVLVLKATALQQQGETGAAIQTFAKALALAEPEKYVRTFLDEGQPVARLLYQALERSISASYAGELLSQFTELDFLPAAQKLKSGMQDQLVEPLSLREIEVLELIAGGLSNREIAERLHITLSTVKGHAANIYGKLGVNSRTQAVSRAQRMGLLPFEQN